VQIELTVPTGSPELKNLAATSLIPENPIHSVASDYGASRLVDDNPLTLAYPAHTHLDYEISLQTVSHVKQVSIWWGYFGTNPIYIRNWNLYSRNGATRDRVLVASGGFPNASRLDIPVDITATSFRLTAVSNHWIGVYEFKAYGD